MNSIVVSTTPRQVAESLAAEYSADLACGGAAPRGFYQIQISTLTGEIFRLGFDDGADHSNCNEKAAQRFHQSGIKGIGVVAQTRDRICELDTSMYLGGS